MALINCPECKNKVSNTADSCPHCGAPISGIKKRRQKSSSIKTIQITSKKLKLQLLITSVMFWSSILWLILLRSDPYTSPIAGIIFIVSIIWYFIIKIRIWWHHE
jgi:uncharacterized membrane protein YvbJ